MTPQTFYVGGPIDLMVGDADERHVRLRDAFDPSSKRANPDPRVYLFCPLCHQRDEPLPPEAMHKRNRAQYLASDIALFFWDIATQPSFGSAIEIWERSERQVPGHQTIVVGPRPESSLYCQILYARGVRWYDTLEQAAAAIRAVWTRQDEEDDR